MKRSCCHDHPQKRKDRAGSAIVEVAVCFPVFMLIVLGIIEFGRAMSINQMLNSAARIGCRAAVLDGSTNTAVTSLVKSQVRNTIGCQDSSITVTIVATSSSTGATLTNVSQATSGDVIDVDVFVPFADVSWSVKQWLGSARIRGEYSMQHE
jgi:Flp pilus assembly protein TadG